MPVEYTAVTEINNSPISSVIIDVFGTKNECV